MRTYEPAWIQLKKDKSISLVAPAKFHRRIYKAIIKEKDMDTVYKYLLSEEKIPKRATLSRKTNSNILTITLTIRDYHSCVISLDDF